MQTTRRFTSISLLLAVAFAASTVHAQNRSVFAGQRNAFAYAYGINQNVAALQVYSGNASTGAASITLQWGYSTAADGTLFYPLSINAPITIDSGAQQETVTPTAVSGCNLPIAYACNITATWTKTHGTGALVTTGTVGLQEALNLQLAGVPGITPGGEVTVDGAWASYGGTTAMLSAAYLGGYLAGLGGNNGYPAVGDIYDNRSSSIQWWDLKPSTTTTISAGSAVTLAQSTGGSLTSVGTYFVSYWYVDVLGGLSPAATDSAQITLTGSNQTITTTAPAATAGAVGWIPLITASGGGTGTEIMVAVTSSNCTLSTIETIIPACAIGATATIAANPSATAKEFVAALATAHTAFAPQPFYTPPTLSIQTSFLPFGSVATVASGSNSDVAMVYIPAGALNFLGKAVDVCFNAAGTDVATAVPTWTVQVTNQYGQSAQTIASVALPTATGALNTTGCFTIQTAVTGSAGKFWGSGTLTQTQGTTTLSTASSIATTSLPASSQPNLTQGIWLTLNLAAATANITGVTVNQFYIRPVTNN